MQRGLTNRITGGDEQKDKKKKKNKQFNLAARSSNFSRNIQPSRTKQYEFFFLLGGESNDATAKMMLPV